MSQITRRICLMLLTGGAAIAQIATPRIGYIVDRESCLRAVEGIAGAFTLGPVLERDVLSAAFSGASLVVKAADHLRIDGRTFEAPEGTAVVVFNAKGVPVEIFFPQANLLWTWQDGAFTSMTADRPTNDVLNETYIRQGELLVDGVPVRLRSQALRLSQLGEGWLAVYSDDGLYAVRGSQVFELPEADSE